MWEIPKVKFGLLMRSGQSDLAQALLPVGVPVGARVGRVYDAGTYVRRRSRACVAWVGTGERVWGVCVRVRRCERGQSLACDVVLARGRMWVWACRGV